MFATAAYAQTAAPGAAGPDLFSLVGLPLILIVLFWFLMIRPQQKRMKQHQQMITNLKRGDQIVMSNGMIGKIVRVEDREVGVEIATGVTVKVVKSMIAEVRVRGEPAAANDAKV
jgi:preprotein translocase subunit YajC